jgi:hypothetical protein
MARKNATPVSIIMITDTGKRLEEHHQGWRAAKIRCRELRGRHPKKTTKILAYAEF